jgi:hypothetical protein
MAALPSLSAADANRFPLRCLWSKRPMVRDVIETTRAKISTK